MVTGIDINKATHEHFARIQRAALVLTGNPWDADDLTQETFMELARSGHRFQGRSSLYTWLYGILLNLDRRERRRRGARRRQLQVLSEHQVEQPASSASESPIEVAEWKQSLWGWVARLPDGQRQALVLRFSEGLAYEEIAQVMRCPRGTVKSRIYYGLMTLRRLMEEEGFDAGQLPTAPCKDLSDAV